MWTKDTKIPASKLHPRPWNQTPTFQGPKQTLEPNMYIPAGRKKSLQLRTDGQGSILKA
jgi:hypothetical protein